MTIEFWLIGISLAIVIPPMLWRGVKWLLRPLYETVLLTVLLGRPLTDAERLAISRRVSQRSSPPRRD